MRPVNKGDEPRKYTNYADAKPDLADRLGTYCSYCERRIATNLAVEHILPKDAKLGYSRLRNKWTNFLLGCVNCNSAKKNTVIKFEDYLLPDRDNTFCTYTYLETGLVEVKSGLSANVAKMAQNTLDLVALNRDAHPNWNEKIMFSALRRFGQRVQAWEQAKESREDYDNGEVKIRRICAEAAATGFFSIWMAAFVGKPEVLRELIKIFAGTSTDCFDKDGVSVSPRKANKLEKAGKS